MSYEQLDKDGKTTYVFHSPPQIFCNDTACPCNLPSEAQQHARDRAAIRNDWYVLYRSTDGADSGVSPALPEDGARQFLANLQKPTNTREYWVQLLRVVEDYVEDYDA